MTLSQILLQMTGLATDSASVAGIQKMTEPVKARVDSITRTLTNPDSIANFTPAKVVQNIKDFDWSGVITSLSSQLISLGLRVLAAIAIFYIGKLIINKIYSVTRTVMIKKDIDQSLTTFLLSFIRISLLFLLIITVIGVAGIETSSFIAIFASAGLAVGMALSGTLQNFAGGVLILFIKPFKVGDYIEFGAFKGFVKEIQIFNTVLTTYGNETIVIPNGGLSTGAITNYTAEGYRRLEWKVAISYGDNVQEARKVILDMFENDDRIIKINADVQEDTPPSEENQTEKSTAVSEKKHRAWWKRLLGIGKNSNTDNDDTVSQPTHVNMPKKNYTPYVAVESLDDSAVTIVARAWAKEQDYWAVLYAINEQIYTLLPKHGIHFPFPQLDVHVKEKSTV